MSEFRSLCHRIGLARSDVAHLFQVTSRTITNWTTRGAPAHVIAALELIAGTLDRHGFPGWTIRAGKLYDPAGQSYTPREIESIPMHLAELAALHTANDHYRQRYPNPYRITTRKAANDEKRPERTPAFTDGSIWIDEPTRPQE